MRVWGAGATTPVILHNSLAAHSPGWICRRLLSGEFQDRELVLNHLATARQLTRPTCELTINNVPRQPYLSVIVPAYNEAASIRRTFASMRHFLDDQDYAYEVILVSDGDDSTPEIAAEIARSWPNLVINAEHGRHGKGHGIRRGAALAQGEIVGFLDADYKTPMDEVTKLLPWLAGSFDIAIGSRGVGASEIERAQRWYRRVGSRGFATLMHAIVGLPTITDSQCGFKFFTRAAATAIFSQARIDGYMCDVEYLYLAAQLGFQVKEIGIRWSDDGDSRLELVRGNMRNVMDLFRIRIGARSMSYTPRVVPLASARVHSNVEG
jgi:dolichyl-phosphate beta-glucosyltransferase